MTSQDAAHHDPMDDHLPQKEPVVPPLKVSFTEKTIDFALYLRHTVLTMGVHAMGCFRAFGTLTGHLRFVSTGLF